MKRYFSALLACASLGTICSQVLVDSIPYPGISQGFWGIHVVPDSIYLGADFSGSIYFSDHDGGILGSVPSGFTYNHGLIKRPGSYLIAKDFTTNGALLHEVSLSGSLMNTWTFPPVIGGNSSGIGDICADGNAIWYTMYYPDFDVYPYAYAYKWIPGDPAPIDTVPLNGAQPYGIALKGDTLFYVTDDLDGDPERIYAYDLANEQDLGFVGLPDPDGDQSPRGLFCDGEYLYLVANRSGGSAFAFQTVFIYALDATTSAEVNDAARTIRVFPSPATDRVHVAGVVAGSRISLLDVQGRSVGSLLSNASSCTFDLEDLPAGPYNVVILLPDGRRHAQAIVVSP